jgi:hypothetical protein
MDKETKTQDLRPGWELATISGGGHLQRSIEMYKELGFEVMVEEARPQECGDCTECFSAAGEKAFRVYKRRPEKAK